MQSDLPSAQALSSSSTPIVSSSSWCGGWLRGISEAGSRLRCSGGRIGSILADAEPVNQELGRLQYIASLHLRHDIGQEVIQVCYTHTVEHVKYLSSHEEALFGLETYGGEEHSSV